MFITKSENEEEGDRAYPYLGRRGYERKQLNEY